MSNLFASTPAAPEQQAAQPVQTHTTAVRVPDYSVSPSGLADHILAFVTGFVCGFAVLFIFYKILLLALVGGLLVGAINIFLASQKAIKKRRVKLRTQFFDFLEAMSVSMRAGNPPLKALESAREDLSLIYPDNSDIMQEVSLAIAKFNNAVPLSVVFEDFAKRSQLEDVASFASIYATIEGKSSRADEIVRETQQIIADKMEIEMEIDTMMSSAKSEVNIMLLMPLVILGIIGYAGSGFMDSIYTTPVGRIVATGGLVMFIISYILAQKFSDIKL